MKKKKKEERDGMQSEHESGRNASTPGWHVPRISRSIVQRMVIQIYIAQWEVSESIHRRCPTNENQTSKVILLIKYLCWT